MITDVWKYRGKSNNGGLPPNESENRYWKNSNSVASFC
ncbi:putative transposase [Shigella boydii 5216-82]|nr:putative transposase [Shigella boydii 5216-82]